MASGHASKPRVANNMRDANPNGDTSSIFFFSSCPFLGTVRKEESFPIDVLDLSPRTTRPTSAGALPFGWSCASTSDANQASELSSEPASSTYAADLYTRTELHPRSHRHHQPRFGHVPISNTRKVLSKYGAHSFEYSTQLPYRETYFRLLLGVRRPAMRNKSLLPSPSAFSLA